MDAVINRWETPSRYNIQYRGRRWYFAGEFSELYNDVERSYLDNEGPIDRSVVEASNIAYYDGRQFFPLNNGTDGEVLDINVDSCLNVYAGGNFSTVANDHETRLQTGPIARWNSLLHQWESLMDDATYDSTNEYYGDSKTAHWWDGHHNQVFSIASDCWHMPANLLDCRCDVYIGGSFVLMFADGTNATNFARWDAQKRQWDALGGPEESGINDVQKPVRSVYRTDANINIVKKAVWVGGEFDGYMKQRMLRASDQSWTTFPDINGPVFSLSYQFNTLGRDFLVVGGDFNFTSDSNGGVHCQYLCVYNLFDEMRGWLPVSQQGIEGHLDSPASSLSFLDVNNYYFLIYGQPSVFISQHNETSIPESFDVTVKDMTACTNYDLSCRKNSLTILGTDNFLRFYDAARRTWHYMGNTTRVSNGVISMVRTVHHGAGSQLRYSLGTLVVVVLSIVTLL